MKWLTISTAIPLPILNKEKVGHFEGYKKLKELFRNNLNLKKINKDFQVDINTLLSHKKERDFEEDFYYFE